jgi:hypothetical protein
MKGKDSYITAILASKNAEKQEKMECWHEKSGICSFIPLRDGKKGNGILIYLSESASKVLVLLLFSRVASISGYI